MYSVSLLFSCYRGYLLSRMTSIANIKSGYPEEVGGETDIRAYESDMSMFNLVPNYELNLYSRQYGRSSTTVSSFSDLTGNEKEDGNKLHVSTDMSATGQFQMPLDFGLDSSTEMSNNMLTNVDMLENMITPTVDTTYYDLGASDPVYKSPAVGTFDLGKSNEFSSLEVLSNLVPISENSEISSNELGRPSNRKQDNFTETGHRRRHSSISSYYDGGSYFGSMSSGNSMYSPPSSKRSSVASVSPINKPRNSKSMASIEFGLDLVNINGLSDSHTINPKALSEEQLDNANKSMLNSRHSIGTILFDEFAKPNAVSSFGLEEKIDFRMQGETMNAIAQWYCLEGDGSGREEPEFEEPIVYSVEQFVDTDETEAKQQVMIEKLPFPPSNILADSSSDLSSDNEKKKVSKRRKRTKSDSHILYHSAPSASIGARSTNLKAQNMKAPVPPPPASKIDITNLSLISSPSNDSAKPFQCSKCEKSFRRQEHLKRHFRSVHSNERPFECSFCEKKFSRSDNLAQHVRTHKR